MQETTAIGLGHLTATIYRRDQSILQHKMPIPDLNSQHLIFLYTIIRNEGLSQQELSRLLFVSKSATAKAAKILEQKQYIHAKSDPHDKRVKHLYLTDKGHQATPIVLEIFREMVNLHNKYLTKEETSQAYALLEKVLIGLNEEKMVFEK